MSSLLGIWSRSGASPRTVVPAPRLDRVARTLESAHARPDRFEAGCAYLLAAAGCLAAGEGRAAACEGFMPGARGEAVGALAARGWPEHWHDAPDGHYSLAFVDPSARVLRLLRGLSGGERLYTLDDGDLLLFASSLRPLLAWLGDARRFNGRKLAGALLTGIGGNGGESLVDGIREVPAGQLLEIGPASATCGWYWSGLLDSPRGSPEELARRYRERLTESVVLAAGAERPVVVTLSGGIDSSAVAAAAVDAFGADAVHAFTYEFDDPDHPTETPFARAVSARLGIRNHHVWRIRMDDFLDAIPETVWRAESFVHWPKAFMLPVTRRLRELGFERQLSGFGIGSHIAYFRELERLYRFAPWPAAWLWYWRTCRGRAAPAAAALERLHPGFEAPGIRTLQLLHRVLARGAAAGDPAAIAPAFLRPVLARLAPDPEPVIDAFRDMPLATRLAHQSFCDLLSCVDVTRWEKVTRELGCHRLSPAHFARCLPYAYLPYEPQLPLSHPERRARPGKHLLRVAYRGVLPDAVLDRRKSWADAVISPAWLQAGARWIRQVLPHYPQGSVADCLAGDPDPELASLLRRWDHRSPQMTVTAIGLWRRLFLEGPVAAAPPGWSDLRALPFDAAAAAE